MPYQNSDLMPMTNADIVELRRLHTIEQWGYKRLAKHFGLNETVARNIVLGRLYNDGSYHMKPWAETSRHFGICPNGIYI